MKKNPPETGFDDENWTEDFLALVERAMEAVDQEERVERETVAPAA